MGGYYNSPVVDKISRHVIIKHSFIMKESQSSGIGKIQRAGKKSARRFDNEIRKRNSRTSGSRH